MSYVSCGNNLTCPTNTRLSNLTTRTKPQLTRGLAAQLEAAFHGKADIGCRQASGVVQAEIFDLDEERNQIIAGRNQLTDRTKTINIIFIIIVIGTSVMPRVHGPLRAVCQVHL